MARRFTPQNVNKFFRASSIGSFRDPPHQAGAVQGPGRLLGRRRCSTPERTQMVPTPYAGPDATLLLLQARTCRGSVTISTGGAGAMTVSRAMGRWGAPRHHPSVACPTEYQGRVQKPEQVPGVHLRLASHLRRTTQSACKPGARRLGRLGSCLNLGSRTQSPEPGLNPGLPFV